MSDLASATLTLSTPRDLKKVPGTTPGFPAGVREPPASYSQLPLDSSSAFAAYSDPGLYYFDPLYSLRF